MFFLIIISEKVLFERAQCPIYHLNYIHRIQYVAGSRITTMDIYLHNHRKIVVFTFKHLKSTDIVIRISSFLKVTSTAINVVKEPKNIN